MVAYKQTFSSLLATQKRVAEKDMPLFKEILKQYPYAQPLHLLFALANKNEADSQSVMSATSIYCSGSTLYKFLYSTRPSKIATSENDRIPERAEDEVFDEISEIDTERFKDVIATQSRDTPSIPDPGLDNFGIENIVATDFFAFENRFIEDPEPEQIISKYDDDKLPYTFLWWLAKTRKEHQQIFQPYAAVKKNAATKEDVQPLIDNSSSLGSEFQQQYVEHIFHIQTPFSAEEHLAPEADELSISGKGKELIENFIRQDPQIRAPKPEQIDTENKAKKSAEDHNDLVSETLAKIYIEQMLYQKAIETYEKLSLKFPEKSRYFADLIQSINKKI